MTTLPACSKFTVIRLPIIDCTCPSPQSGPLGVAHQHAGLEMFVHRRSPPRGAAGDALTAAPDLSALVSARLCHDLISPMGAIGNGLELLADGRRPGAGRARAGQREPRHRAGQAPLLPHRLRPGRRPGAAVRRGGGAAHRRDVPRPLHRRLARRAAPTCRGRWPGIVYLAMLCLEKSLPMGGHVRVAIGRAPCRSRSTAGAPRRRRRSGRMSPAARRSPASRPTACSSRCCARRSRDRPRIAVDLGEPRRAAIAAAQPVLRRRCRRRASGRPEPVAGSAPCWRGSSPPSGARPADLLGASARAPPSPGRPTTSTPSGIALPSVTSAPAPTSAPVPDHRAVQHRRAHADQAAGADRCSRAGSPCGRSCSPGRWSAGSRCRCGRRSRPARSSRAPTTIGSLSPRSTALNQTEAPGSRITRPISRAPGATQKSPSAGSVGETPSSACSSVEPPLEFAVQPAHHARRAPAAGRGAAARRAMIARSSASHSASRSLTST